MNRSRIGCVLICTSGYTRIIKLILLFANRLNFESQSFALLVFIVLFHIIYQFFIFHHLIFFYSQSHISPFY